MPPVEVLACRGPNCSEKSGFNFVPDIEELFNDCPNIRVDATGCFNKCAQGPNVRVGTEFATGVSGWKQIVALAGKAGVQVDNMRKKVGELKFQSRKEKGKSAKLSLLDKAFGAIGGETKGESSFPKILGELLTYRASLSMQDGQTAKALADALKATQLLPGWGSAYVVLASAHVALGQLEEAAKAVDVANEYKGFIDNKELSKAESKTDEWKEQKKQEAEAEEAKVRQAAEQEDKKKKEAQAKAKAKAKAKALALKRKKEAEAKAKAEAEAKAKAEEEARLAEEERLRLEEEARIKAEEEERLRLEEEARLKAEEEEKLRQEREEMERLRLEEEERLRKEAEAEAQRREEERREKEAAQKAWEEAEAARIAYEATFAGMFQKFCCRSNASKTAEVVGEEPAAKA